MSVPDTHVECEVCKAQYEKKEGSSNTCPLCNTPGGKLAVATDVIVGPAALDGLIKAVMQLSSRVADLERRLQGVPSEESH
jgi:hypothetical protein